MTPSPRSLFVEARTRAEHERTIQQRQAVLTVASNARDSTDFTALLAMLGLDDPAHQQVPLSDRLAVYVGQVAAAVGVKADATAHEATGSETATASIGLDDRCVTEPDLDLVLMWDERLGWYVAMVTDPAGAPVIVAYLDGDTVPAPAAVARFVADTASGRATSRIRPVLPATERAALAERMATVC